MSDKKTAHKPPPRIPEDFDPQPTVFTGGIDRMLACFEAQRDLDTAGYRSGSVLSKVDGWSVPVSDATVCSPFTATVLGMLFDPSGATSGGPFKPVYQQTRDRTAGLPIEFYMLHQVASILPLYQERIKKARGIAHSGGPESLVAFNLGYRIDARDMRRGDYVAIDWNPAGGHSTFCWDVHLRSIKGHEEVDCFQFVSANGNLKPAPGHGPGVSVGTLPAEIERFLQVGEGRYTKKLNPLFADRVEYVKYATWHCRPGVRSDGVDKATFREKPLHVVDGRGIQLLGVARLWGVAPPTTDPNHPRYRPEFELAAKLQKWDAPKPYSMGNAPAEPPPTHVENVRPVKVAGSEIKKDPEAPEKKPWKPVEQKTQVPTDPQVWVEIKLKSLFLAGWIDKDPGDADAINDGRTREAVKAFQAKYGADEDLQVDGIAGPRTRPVLDRIVGLLLGGQPDPGVGRAADKPVTLDKVYWEYNRVDPAGRAHLKIEASEIGRVRAVKLELSEVATKITEVVHFRGDDLRSDGPIPFHMPPSFGLTARVAGKIVAAIDGGGEVRADVHGELVVAPIPAPTLVRGRYRAPDSLLPWDDTKWPRWMRNIVEELRTTRKPESGGLERWSLTQYGVKTRILPGDVPVLDEAGRGLGTVALDTLKRADIEGTMLLGGRMLNIGKSHGWDYDPVTHKPQKGSFKPERSRWVDVTEKHPFGSGAALPLVPFRVLAVNPRRHPHFYKRKVYIRQLDGLTMPTGELHNGICVVGDCGGMVDHHFDWFCGNEDAHLSIPKVGERDGRQLVELALLGPSSAAGK